MIIKSVSLKSCHLTIFAKQLLQLLIIHVLAKVLDINVSKLSGSCSKLSFPLFTRFEAPNKSVNNMTSKIYFLTSSKYILIKFKSNTMGWKSSCVGKMSVRHWREHFGKQHTAYVIRSDNSRATAISELHCFKPKCNKSYQLSSLTWFITKLYNKEGTLGKKGEQDAVTHKLWSHSFKHRLVQQ